ncbi:hypothetical protein J8F10_24330 [Gemmata sp. G18]|uniref:Uncharacterized protein n=1 Tax=Gemmata palustris TaxID=2822762 RepID=A0ABS5BXC0_9BACT|nr:hypothetical protein [Gemmata palustris]MBP3958389.1 hypothetical protein [Gemmata palustris]
MKPEQIKAALSKNVTVSARRKLHIAASRKGYVPFRDAAYILESAINTTLTTALVDEIRALRKILKIEAIDSKESWELFREKYFKTDLMQLAKEAIHRTAWVDELEADNKEGA